jgi:chaperonin GroES
LSTVSANSPYVPDQSQRIRAAAFRPGARDQTVGVDHMNVRPLHDRIIVQRIDEGEQKVGGIIIPDTAKEKPQQGKVIAVGLGKREKAERVPLDVKEGETILFGKYSGQDIKLDGQEYLIMREDEVLAVLDSK